MNRFPIGGFYLPEGFTAHDTIAIQDFKITMWLSILVLPRTAGVFMVSLANPANLWGDGIGAG